MSNNENSYTKDSEPVNPNSEEVLSAEENELTPNVEELLPADEPVLEEEKVATKEDLSESPAVETYDPAVTPALSNEGKKKLSMGWLITGLVLLCVLLMGMVAFIFTSVQDKNESRDAIQGLNLDSMGLSVVEDTIDGNHFLVSGKDQ
ncbi:MAG: hypothetical protein H9W81_06050, partial [Enterococcus sp.]|nr:hypothetical protein [Enterococcus sp.]